jgi:hypothetical protein
MGFNESMIDSETELCIFCRGGDVEIDIVRGNAAHIPAVEGKENSVQLGNDNTDSSYIVIDGVHFAPVGFDDNCGIDYPDLVNGVQERIHNACRRAAAALALEVTL